MGCLGTSELGVYERPIACLYHQHKYRCRLFRGSRNQTPSSSRSEHVLNHAPSLVPTRLDPESRNTASRISFRDEHSITNMTPASSPVKKAKFKHSTPRKRNRIFAYYSAGVSAKAIAVKEDVLESHVRGVIRRFSAQDYGISRPGRGRPQKLTERDQRVILREVAKDPLIPLETLRKLTCPHVSRGCLRDCLTKKGIHRPGDQASSDAIATSTQSKPPKQSKPTQQSKRPTKGPRVRPPSPTSSMPDADSGE